jgi:putative transposase
MPTGRPKAKLELTSEEQTQLNRFATSRTLPHSLVSRAKVVLWSAEGQTNTKIADRLGWTKATVGKWRLRFVQYRTENIVPRYGNWHNREALLHSEMAYSPY